MSRLLKKLFVFRFFEINAGFFLLLLMLLFGLLNAHDAVLFHTAIMTAIAGSWKFCGVALLIMLLYGIKCILFCLNTASDSSNLFLSEIQAVNSIRLYIVLVRIFGSIYMPAIAYFSTAAAVGFAIGNVGIPVVLVLYQLLVIVLGAAILFLRLNITIKPIEIQFPKPKWLNRNRIEFWLLQYALHSKKSSFITIKVCSIGLLQVMIWANENVLDKESVCVLLMFIIAAHALLPLHFVAFIEGRMVFLRNLPLSILYRYGLYAFTYAVIFLPELAFLAINGNGSIPFALTITLYSLAIVQMCLFTSILYSNLTNLGNYTIIVFVLFFLSLLTMASLPLWFIIIIEFSISIALFPYLYSKYDK